MRFQLIFAVLLLCWGKLSAQDFQLSDTDDIAEAEFHVAINPTDTNNIVVCTMHGFAQVTDSYFSIYYTEDFGITWKESNFQGMHSGDEGAGDPVLSFDAEGDLYLVHLVVTKDSNIETVLSKSADKGKSWTKVYNYPAAFTDKPWLAIDRGANSPYKGNIYLPDVIDSVRLITVDQNHTLLHDNIIPNIDHIPSVVVGKNGDVFTSGMRWFANPLELWVQHYTDGGTNLISSVPVVSTPDYTFDVDSISNRFQPCPYLAIDNSDGPYSGRLYYSFTKSEEDQLRYFDVMLSYSDDKGLTWTEPKAVHSNLEYHVQQYYSSLYVNDNGVLLIDWYDRKNYGANSLNTDFFLGISNDGGDTFTEYKMNTQPMDFDVAVDAGLNLGNPISGVNETGLVQDKFSISNIYPQPVKDKLNVDVSLSKAAQLKYQIFSMDGKLLQSANWESHPKGESIMQINAPNIPGTYVLKVVSEHGQFKSFQFIKQGK